MSDRGDKKAASPSSAPLETVPSTHPDDLPAEPLRSPLVKILESDVIPRLAATRGIQLDEQLRHWTPDTAKRTYPRSQLESESLDMEKMSSFLQALLDDDLATAAQIVERHLNQQGALGFIKCCHELLQPAARALGEMWEEDTADFHQVTRAAGHLQALLRRMPSGPNPALTERVVPSRTDGRYPRIMLLPAAGEQHTLGISMLGRAFSDAGWLIDGGPGLSPMESRKRMARTSHDVLGISISCASWIEPAAAQVEELRTCSRNRELQVLVGGPLLSHEPNLVTLIGADDSATDLHDALEVAAAMLERCVVGEPC